jgi:hypothetical protein
MTDDERRYAAFSAVEEARASGDRRALGWALIHLSQLARQIGLGEGGEAFPNAARAGLQAVEIFRELDDPKGLSTALRVGAVPFVGVNTVSMLEEAIQVASDAGDREQMAWGLLAAGRMQSDHLRVAEALSLFAELKHAAGEGYATQSYAIQAPVPRIEKAVLLERAGDLLFAAAEMRDAHRALLMAETFGSPDIGTDERIRLLERSLMLAENASDRALVLRCLTRVAEETGRSVQAEDYRASEDALDIELYGSRQGRLERDIELFEEMLPTYPRKERAAVKLKISALRQELDTLSEG